ncbi:MAG: tRNA (adenosine(37)-N6)-threonylcarbamoyltransferase complex ATPase subunit type 1 TsaE [Clostridia bacterium]|nr:tRNA (adenosine(37)-N6)-threonylcarbamoyltransferase complex ATPase subunit type 1 TsaE [Clostridia bacterium]
MKEFYSKNLSDTDAVAAEIASLLKKGDVLALYGEMGAGKTAFVRGLVKALCPECLPLVHSPTFAIVNEYEGNEITVYHYDLYRIADEDDLYSTGYFDRLGGEGIVVTEWSELIDGAIPQGAHRLRIEKAGETERKFTLC